MISEAKRYYIHSAYALPNAAKQEQERASLRRVDDSFKKMIIVKDTMNTYCDESGITTMGLFSFLLDANSLDK